MDKICTLILFTGIQVTWSACPKTLELMASELTYCKQFIDDFNNATGEAKLALCESMNKAIECYQYIINDCGESFVIGSKSEQFQHLISTNTRKYNIYCNIGIKLKYNIILVLFMVYWTIK